MVGDFEENLAARRRLGEALAEMSAEDRLSFVLACLSAEEIARCARLAEKIAEGAEECTS